jgi:hypothetical protein
VHQIHQWALEQRALPRSPLANAIACLGQNWDGLRVFLTDVPLDNNRAERGTRVAAMMYSVVESAKLSGIDPDLYLKLAALEAIGGRPVAAPRPLGPSCGRNVRARTRPISIFGSAHP